jgi:molybdate transport system substrate-binding protein
VGKTVLSPSAHMQSAQAALARPGCFLNSRAMGILHNIISLGLGAVALAMPLSAEPVTIFAASSLKTALDSVIVDESLNAIAVYGGSAALARQVSQGAGADIVILAHSDWLDWLGEQGALVPTSRCNLIGNRLVLAGASDAGDLNVEQPSDLIDALKGGRLATGYLKSVPAGQYPAAYLEQSGWLDALVPHLAETSNVRLALALIARGEVSLGFVYASDVAAEMRVRTVFTPAREKYPAIRYPAAVTREANGDAADVLLKLAASVESFENSGFTALPATETGRCP